MNLALICDVRLAGESARFDDRFLQIGIHPGGGHTWMFQNICGPQATAAAVLFSEVLSGAEAERVGLAHRCVPDDQLLPAAIIITVVGFMESIAVAKVYARRHRYDVDPNQELVGQGLSNIVSGLFSGYAVSGSFSRSAASRSFSRS